MMGGLIECGDGGSRKAGGAHGPVQVTAAEASGEAAVINAVAPRMQGLASDKSRRGSARGLATRLVASLRGHSGSRYWRTAMMRCCMLHALIVAACAAATVRTSGAAEAPTWSDWERAHAVAHEGQWLVIRQPGEGFCYVKQSYEDSTDKMELSMKKDGVPHLVTPFFRGIQGDVSYHIKDGPVRIVPEAEASALGIKLSSTVVSEMMQGGTLSVRVKPVGQSTVEQRFDLRGFAAAAQWLNRPACLQKDEP